MIKEGHPTWAAILLLHRHPQRFLSQAVIHCGRFKEETIVIDDKMIEGTIIEQVEEAMDFIRKNINVKFIMTGKPAREEIWDYPLEALREAIINAVCHRDYTVPSNTEVRIYDDSLIVWSPGGLPFGITIEDLYKPHSSVLRNKGIAGVFYDMRWIEQWGSGIDKMREACMKAGLPEPRFEEYQGFRVIFNKDIYTEESLRKFGLNERQIKAVRYTKENGRITNKEYQEITGLRKRQSTDDLKQLEDKKILVRIGTTGKSAYYVLKGRQRGERGSKGAPKGQETKEKATEEFKKYFKETAKGVVLEYIRGVKKKATLNWAWGSLREMTEHEKLSFDEIQNIISKIKAEPMRYLLDDKRKEKLKEIEKKLKAMGKEE